MAKRKHAAALFEVFNDNRGMNAREKPPVARSSSRWWFMGRGSAAGSTTAVDPNDPTTMPIKSPLIAPRIAAVEAMEAPPAKAPAPQPTAQTGQAVVEPAAASTESAPDSPASTQRFHLDLDRREVTMRLPFTTVVAACFGVMLTFALCYVVGRRVGAISTPLAKTAPMLTADDDESQPVQPTALDVPRRTVTPIPTPKPKTPIVTTPQPLVGETHPREHESAPIANSVKGLVTLPKPPAEDGPRMIGLNYWLVQTYPNEQGAIEARDFLLKNGVSCTVEKAPAGFAVDPSWYAVVSTHGFEHIHTAECENLKHQIEKAGEKFAGNGKFKRFAPQLFKLK